MRNFVRPGEVNRILDQRRRKEKTARIMQRIIDILSGVAIGFLIGLAVYMLK